MGDRVADRNHRREERFGALCDILVVLADMTRHRVWQMLESAAAARDDGKPTRKGSTTR